MSHRLMGISCVTSTWKDGVSHAFSQRRPPTTAKAKTKPRRSRGCAYLYWTAVTTQLHFIFASVTLQG